MKKNLCLVVLLSSLGFGQSALASTLGVWNELGEAGNTPGTAQHLTGTGVLDTITGTMNNTGTDTDVFRIYISDPANFSITMDGTSLSFDNDTNLYVLDDSHHLLFADADSGPDGLLSQLNAGQFASHAAGFYLVAYNIYETLTVRDNDVEYGVDVFPPNMLVKGWRTTGNSPQFGTVQLNFTGARFDAPPLPSSVPTPVPLILTLMGIAGFGFSKRYANLGHRKVMSSHC
ncbi:hypothetical protein [Crenothrix sp.]|uniref:hypothetical protein n=1 Tax=Crenothrix sp. TaxID=3100433 RepID=UPI00374D3A16